MEIRPMDKDFILFRCLHCGPLSPANIETKSGNFEGISISKEQFARNKKFLAGLIDAYGSCALLAVEGDLVVAHARFSPQAIHDRVAFCCQEPKNAITQQMVEMDLPAIENPEDRILWIDCLLVEKGYRGRGLSHALIDGVLEWAQSHGWKAVRSFAYLDNYWLSSHMCAPMLRTYRKHGFKKIKTLPVPEAKELLLKIREGKLGAGRKKDLEKLCAGEDLSSLTVYHEVERQL